MLAGLYKRLSFIGVVLTFILLFTVACGSQNSTPTQGTSSPSPSPSTGASSPSPSPSAAGSPSPSPTQAAASPSASPTTAASPSASPVDSPTPEMMPTPTETSGSGGVSGNVSLTGAGSTFVAPFFSNAFQEYSKQHPNIKVNYQAIGSGGGIEQFTAQTVDFAASDVPMNEDELAAAKQANGEVIEFPVALGAITLAYNIPGVDKGLKLTPEAVAGIFLGKITKWNDPAIAKANPGVKLPDRDIVVVHRADSSGSTYIFTDYLSHISSEWKNGPGTSKEVDWPVGLGAQGNSGVASQIRNTPGSIGYVELAYVLESKMDYAYIQNKAGKFVEPTLEATTAAASQFPQVSPEKFSIVNAPGARSYPIAGYTWAIVWQQYSDANKAAAIKELMGWVVTDAQESVAKKLNYAPLPQNAQQLAQQSLDKVK